MSAIRPLRTSASPEEQERAIIAEAAAEFARVGVRRANMDDVAKRSGVSRSTLYRRFPNKEQLLVAVVRDETDVIFRRLVKVMDNRPPREAFVEAFCHVVREAQTSPLLRELIVTEPELFGSLVGFVSSGSDVTLDRAAAKVAHTMRRLGARMPDDDLRTVTELQIRITSSLLSAPSRTVRLDDDAAVRDFAEKFLAPMIW